ncbi:pilus assembly protein PilW [Pseudomonas sp.]|uniref:PilW family protein n=1 Tax=Pseudomonas sp. TaxID=306 RepID=UPI0028A5C19E|nr:pilus assembly protein PilW [Pseudomonas sp.]
MSIRQAGIGLIEALIALALGLMVLAGASQVFIAAYQTWRLQAAAQQLQGDARLALTRIAQDIRMAGAFGCLRLNPEDFNSATAAAAFTRPVEVNGERLGLIVAELPGHTGAADWTLHTDCQTWARVHEGRTVAPFGTLALAIRRLEYRFEKGKLMLVRTGSKQPLLDHVQRLHVNLVDQQRIDLQLELYEPQWRLTQHYSLSVALRNSPATP